jgi:hypothetical protein
MSGWLRRIYSRVTKFNLSDALRAAGLGGMDRGTKHMRDEPNKSGKCSESNKSSESDQPYKLGQRSCPSHPTRTCDCPAGTCDDNSTNLHVEGCICSICRDYNDYNTAANKRTKRQDTSTGIRFSNESRSFKQPHPDATRTDVESVTGIPTGIAI